MKIAPHPHVFGNTDLGSIRPGDFSSRQLQELDDKPQPKNRGLVFACVLYMVVMVSVITAAKYFVTGSI